MSILELPWTPFLPSTSLHLAVLLSSAIALGGCKGKTPPAETQQGSANLVRVRVPEAKCEVAIPAKMTITDAKATSFRIAEKDKNPLLFGTLVVIMPMGPDKEPSTPPDATDVKLSINKTNPDGSVEREGSYKTPVQSFYTAEYVYPIGKSWLYCKTQTSTADRRDEKAKLCRGLAPKAL